MSGPASALRKPPSVASDMVVGVLQAALQTDLALNYLCDGPRVPEDLHEPDPELLLNTLFSGPP